MERLNKDFNLFFNFIDFCNTNKFKFDPSISEDFSTSVNYYRKGSKIKIKKENRGKFTDYCGGKVTSECIQRGKHSSDPKIRKRATFAANARKWKHLNGGSFQINKDKYIDFSYLFKEKHGI